MRSGKTRDELRSFGDNKVEAGECQMINKDCIFAVVV